MAPPPGGNLTVDNYGTITGSVNQGTQAASSLNSGLSLPSGQSTITTNNYQGATLNAGPVINLAGGTLTNSGLLSMGTVHSALTGNYTQTGTGIFQVTLNNDGSCGLLNVSGTANLGGSLQLGLKNSIPLLEGTRYSLLTGNITGSFANLLMPPTPLLHFDVEYTGAGAQSGAQIPAGGNAVEIVSHVNSFTSVTSNSTHTAIGSYLDRLMETNPTGRFARILAEFQRLDLSQFHGAFESLSPGIYGADTDSTFAITRQYTRTLQQRLEAVRSIQWAEASPQAFLSERSIPLLASSGSNALPGQMPGRDLDNSPKSADSLGFWMQGFGQWGNRGSIDGVGGYNYGLGGTAFGLDYAFTRELLLGANFGYSYTSLNMDNGIGDGRINSLFGSLYGTYFTDRAYVESIFTYGNHHYDNSRRINIGSLQSANGSSHTGNAFSVLTEAGIQISGTAMERAAVCLHQLL